MWNRLFQIRSSTEFRLKMFFSTGQLFLLGGKMREARYYWNRLLNIMLQTVVFHLLLDGWMEKYKQATKRSTQKSKGVRKHHRACMMSMCIIFNT